MVFVSMVERREEAAVVRVVAGAPRIPALEMKISILVMLWTEASSLTVVAGSVSGVDCVGC